MRGRLILSALLLGSGLGLPAPGGMARADSAHEPVSTALPTPHFRHYGVAEGLSGGAVHDVVQDQDGLMWFAAGSDLVRFDGMEFTVFRHRRDDPFSLPAGGKRGLFVDRDNRLWVGGRESGLIQRLVDGQGFLRWVHHVGEPGSLSSDAVWSIAQTPNGELWVGTEVGLDRLLADRRHFEHVALPLGDGRSGYGAVHALLAESDGRLWIGTGHGLFLRSPAGLVKRVAVDPRLASEPAVWRIQGAGNDVRVAVAGGSLRVDPDGVARLVAPVVDPTVTVHGSTRDRLGHLWTATSSGLYLEEGGRITRIPAQPQLRGGLPGYHVDQALLDHEGGLWLALGDDGVGYLAPDWNRFTRLTHVAGDATSLSEYAASAVLASSDGKLWVGAGHTVDKLDPATGHVQHVLRGLPGEVRDLLEDRDGNLWIIADGAIYRHARGGLLQVDISPTRALVPQRLALGADGAVLVVSLHRGLFRVDPDMLGLRPATWAPAGENIVLANRLTADSVLGWYATGSQLWHWNATRARFDDAPGLTPGGPVLALETTADGLWVARGDRFEHYRANGSHLSCDRELPTLVDWPVLTLRAMHVDRLGRVWLFAAEGLWRFDPDPGRLIAFGPYRGLESGHMDGVSPVGGHGGMVYFAGPDGVTGFRPDRALAQFGHPHLSLTSVKAGRRGQALHLPTSPGALQLDWNDGGPRIAARLASYVDPRSNHYRFRLHGLDEDWVDTGNRAEREFPVLAAGNYTLEVAAAGVDGWWSELAVPLHITVRSPPWVAWQAWALYLAGATLLLALWALVQRRSHLTLERLRMLEERRRMAEQANEAKTSFLTVLSHEIRTPMTGILGMTELLSGSPLTPVQHNYVRSMQRSGNMLMRLLNDALDLARIEAGRLELEPAPFDPRELLREIQQLEGGLAELKGIRLECHVADDVPGQFAGDALRIKQVLLNLVGNALKFTDYGSVQMVAEGDQAGLRFSVSDTGPGISAANRPRLFQRFEQLPGPHRAAGSGLGLAICRELVGLMGGSIRAEPGSSGGTTFRVQLPLPVVAAPLVPTDVGLRPEPHWAVLLVEHETEVALEVRAKLEAHGHSVNRVSNGLEALSELAHASFDLVLVETDLPGVDGFRVARLIRATRLNPPGPTIVAIAARVDAAGAGHVHDAGMDGLICRPLTGGQWLPALSRVMAARLLHGQPAQGSGR